MHWTLELALECSASSKAREIPARDASPARPPVVSPAPCPEMDPGGAFAFEDTEGGGHLGLRICGATYTHVVSQRHSCQGARRAWGSAFNGYRWQEFSNAARLVAQPMNS